jgi:hypothetical protein
MLELHCRRLVVHDAEGGRRVELYAGTVDDTGGVAVFDSDGCPAASLSVSEERGPRHVLTELAFGHRGDPLLGIGLADGEPTVWSAGEEHVEIAGHLFGR